MRQSFGKLHIRKRTASEWILYFIFFLPIVQAFLSEFIGIPDAIKFLADAALICLLIKIILIIKNVRIGKGFKPFLVLISVFFVYTLITYFFNFQSIFYYLWGLRNNFRFYIAFMAYVLFLSWEDAKSWLKVLDWLYVLNFFVLLVQFFMGYRQDYLGGIFGVQKGCNGTLLVFFSVVTIKTVLEFMRNEGSTVKCIIFTFIGLLCAALSELKFFFLLFIGIVLAVVIMTKSSIRKTVFITLAIIMILAFSALLSVMYEEFAGFLSIDKLWGAFLNPNYATDEDIGRLTAIPVISDYFLTSVPQQLFGIGLGNADTSSIALFNTPFFEMYGMIHYTFFSYSFLFLETGIIGLLLYTSFFITAFVVALKLYKRKKADPLICQLTMIFTCVCIAFMFYNGALRMEAGGYLAFFVLALPLISSKATKNGWV